MTFRNLNLCRTGENFCFFSFGKNHGGFSLRNLNRLLMMIKWLIHHLFAWTSLAMCNYSSSNRSPCAHRANFICLNNFFLALQFPSYVESSARDNMILIDSNVCCNVGLLSKVFSVAIKYFCAAVCWLPLPLLDKWRETFFFFMMMLEKK